MIGMSFTPFVTLLAIGFISAFVLHVLVQYRILAGFDGFMGKWIAGWIGGWLGAPVFGYWGIHTGNVYIIPALLGAFAGSFLIAALPHGLVSAGTAVRRREALGPQAGTAPQIEMRKAS